MTQTILVIFTIHTEHLPDNFPEMIQHEQDVVANLKQEGFIEHLFLRPEKNGAVIVFKNIDDMKAKALMESLPLYQFMKSVEYYPLMKQF